jgi:hypothetical protein
MAEYDYSRGFADRAAMSLFHPGAPSGRGRASDRQTRNRDAATTRVDPDKMWLWWLIVRRLDG